MNTGVAAIGEVMVEFAPATTPETFQLGFAGDTFNTSVTLARLGIPTAYVTLLGDDPFSDNILALMQREGISAHCVERLSGRQPGLYVIANAANGERTFRYWRDEAPARELWQHHDSIKTLEERLNPFACLYLSGITLAILCQDARQRLYKFLVGYRQRGGRVVFDSNFRPRLWLDTDVARAVIGDFLRITDVALLTLEDEQALWGEMSPQELIEYHRQNAVDEMVIKQGGDPVVLCEKGRVCQVAVPAVADVVDTTGAGDAFNAGYLARRLQGGTVEEAAAWGNCAAASIIRRKGGVIPRDEFLQEMPVNK